MSIDPDSFRAVLGRFASGVTVVTTRDSEGMDLGMTVSAFCSLSLEPPLVLVCIAKDAGMHEALIRENIFIVNILSDGQEALARRFAAANCKRFDGVGYTRGNAEVARLDDALAHLECTVKDLSDGGDHTIVIGEVQAVSHNDAKPLLYYRGGYAQID